ncbi:MAG: transglutaminase family protein [Planctomycetota bacterium]
MHLLLHLLTRFCDDLCRSMPTAWEGGGRRVRRDNAVKIPATLLMVALLAGINLPCLTGYAQPNDAERVLAAELEGLIEHLDSNRFSDRQLATRRLRELGESAYPALLAAGQHASPEVRSRASWILRDSQERVIKAAFSEFSRLPDAKLDIEQGMWLISRLLNPAARRQPITDRLDELAKLVRRKLGDRVDPASADPVLVLQAIRVTLFEDEQFGGALRDYRHPANSSLEQVLQRRRGLPIVLSHLVIAVGERLRLPLVGLPLGGRYMVRYEGRRGPVGFEPVDRFMDPFDGGKIYAQAEDLVRAFPGLTVDDLPPPTTNRLILVRMLNNLETHLYEQGDVVRAELALACKIILAQDFDSE